MRKNIKFIVLVLMLIPGSGIEADAATEIDACGTISVPGTYILNQSIPNSPASPSCINIVSSDVVFDGAGYEIDGIGAEIGVYVRNFPTILTNVTVKNLIVTDWDYGIYYADTNDGIIDNTTVTSIDLYGIPLVNASNNTLTNNTLSSNSQGIYLITSSNYNNLTNNNASFNAIGIYLDSSSNNKLTNNTVNSNTQNGIYLKYDSEYNNLTDNTVYSNNWNGIYIYSSSDYNNLTGNNASSNTYDGIYLYGSGSNTLMNNIASSNERSGIHIEIYDGEGTEYADDNTLINNTANSNTQDGICLESSSNNDLTDNSANLNEVNGIHLNSSSSNNLTNNTVDSNTQDGIYLSSSSYNNLTDNTANSNTEEGIYLQSSSYNNLTRNTANSNTWNGIILYTSTGNILTGNTANLNILNGIYLEDSNDNIVESNALDSNNNGIYTHPSSPDPIHDNIYRGNDITNSISDGIFLEDYCAANIYSITIENNNITDASNGIHIYSECSEIFDFTIRGNNISNSMDSGIYLDSSSDYLLHDNLIYNNYLSNDNNFVFPAVNSNVWNTTITSGTNIVDGSYLGGNFWAYPDGTGFSQTCTDADGNGICDDSYELDADNTDYLPLSLNFSPDTTPPASITNLTAGSTGQTYINWTWTDPSDSDFTNVTIYLNGVFKSNVSKGVLYYYAGGLSADTQYILSTRTVDQAGNINQTWKNNTARTSTSQTTTSSGGSSGGYYYSPPPTATAAVTATASVTPTPQVLKLSVIKVSPPIASVVAGKNQIFTASVTDQFGNPVTIEVSWSSSNNSVGTIDTAGVFTASAPGNATITARSKDASGTAKVTVTPATGYRIWLSTPLIFSDVSQVKGYEMSFIANPTTSGFSRAVGDYKISLNLYSTGVGGVYTNNRYKLYLVPGQAHISYTNGITVNDPISRAPIKSFLLNYISTEIDNLLKKVVNLFKSVM